MEKYYTFLCETYNGDKLEICVLANSEDHTRERLSDYEVSKGELYYSRTNTYEFTRKIDIDDMISELVKNGFTEK